MQPAARLAATIELLDAILTAWRQDQRIPADKQCDIYFKARRYIGSHDRGAVAELVYWCLRHKGWIDWWGERHHMLPAARTAVIGALMLRRDVPAEQLAALFTGGKFAPLPLSESEWQFARALAAQEPVHPDMPDCVRLNYPEWMEPLLQESLGKNLEAELVALAAQAPLDLRANTLLCTRDGLLTLLHSEGFQAEPAPLAPYGIRLTKREPVFATAMFRQGFFEVQDEGSQAIAYLTDAQPGMRVIDFCAGAGGKTLALAADMQNKGRILAWDTSAKRLAQLPQRLKRAQVFNTEWRVLASEADSFIKRHKLSADRVLTDVPCSGSGTWRRNPDLKWRFTRKDLDEVLDVQQRILDSAARLVKVGGRLIYSTCSLFKCENEQQVARFLETHRNFRVVCAQKIWNKTPVTDADANNVSFLCLTPHQDGCDGFFAAVLERQSA